MSNNGRKVSKSGFYHAMIRGVNRQTIFSDDYDRRFFLKELKTNIRKFQLEVHAFCLMDNHVHLLLKAEMNMLSRYMRTILTNYVTYYNKKQNRSGHLLENRFKSETVEDDKYYLVVLRYILQNPEKAFICSTDQYRWSSFHSYDFDSFIETSYAIELCGSKNELIRFLLENNRDECLEILPSKDEKEQKYQIYMKNILGKIEFSDLKSLSRNQRNLYIREMRRCNIPVRFISNITGISRGVIERA